MPLEFRVAISEDKKWIGRRDETLGKEMLQQKIDQEEILLALLDEQRIGFLRWSYFWDVIPFMNRLGFDKGFRQQGYGRALVACWERRMLDRGINRVMTSTLSDENAQHFYRKLGYVDTGALLLPGEALEILFAKALT